MDFRQLCDTLSVGDPAPVPPQPREESQIISGWKGAIEEPLVSVVCPTFNHAAFIRDAIHGFLMQETSFPFRVILYDDASTDGTADIVREYADRYPLIIKAVLQAENHYSKGVRHGRFTAPLIKGRYRAHCEGDDYWLDASKLQIQVERMEQDPGLVLCYHDFIEFESGCVTRVNCVPKSRHRRMRGRELERGKYVPVRCALMRNVRLERVPEQAKVVNGDDFLLSRLGGYGDALYLPQIAPAFYRLHPGGVWSKIGREHKQIQHVVSAFWIMQYYSRTGRPDLAAHYSGIALERLVKSVSRLSLTSALRALNAMAGRWIKTAPRRR